MEPSVEPQRIAPGRDAIVGANGSRREVLWYETYDDDVPNEMRSIVRSAVEAAARSTRGRIGLRMLPPKGNVMAVRIARAVVSAGWQGAAPEMHRAVTAGPRPNDLETLIDLARALDLDVETFAADLDAPRTMARIVEDRALAEASGHPRGPLLFVDGRLYDGALDHEALREAIERPLGLRLRQRSRDFFDWAAAGGLILVLATVAALIVANSPPHETYEHLRESVLSLGWNDARFGLTVEQWVNDGLMTVFFLIVGIEIKREVVAGELSDPSRAALPIVAAVGGMAVPAAIFAVLNGGAPTASGWGVPMATDIAFTLGLLALLGDRVPPALRVFVSALAIADDLGAILVIAIFYSSGIDWVPLALAAAILAAMAGLNRGRVYALWPYLVLGLALWATIFAGGLHATLAGVLTALAIPSRRPAAVHGVAVQTAALMQAEARRAEPGEGFAHHTVERLGEILGRLREPGEKLKHGLETWTNFLILPLFAFFNTGIVLAGSGFDPLAPVSLGIVAGLVIGKPLGICVATWVVLRAGLATKSEEIGWRHIIGAGCLCGIGFTMSIFISGAAFAGPALDQAKIAVLGASVLAAALGMEILRGAPRTQSGKSKPR